MPFTTDPTNPTDNSFVDQFPANERAHRTQLQNMYEVEHDVATGRHQIAAGSTSTRDGFTDWCEGAFYVNADDSRLRIQRAASVSGGIPAVWQLLGQEFLVGTVVVFAQPAAPTGWTQLNIHDVLLRSTGTTGFGLGGNWAISGLSAETANHAHTFNVTPTTSAKSGGSSQGTSSSGGPSTPLDNHTHTVNVAGTTSTESAAHTHTGDGTWRPAYIDVLLCQKQ